MDVKLINCIEAIANLHYLIRISQNDPAAVASYLDRADETLEALVRHLRLGATQPRLHGSVRQREARWPAVDVRTRRTSQVR
jgi:plasmid stabilization system protein ParE